MATQDLPTNVFGPDKDGKYWKIIYRFSGDGPMDVYLYKIDTPYEKPKGWLSSEYYLGAGNAWSWMEDIMEKLEKYGVPQDQLSRKYYFSHAE